MILHSPEATEADLSNTSQRRIVVGNIVHQSSLDV